MQIFVIVEQMSSPNQILASRLTNEKMTLETDYKFKPETRRKIGAIRTLYKKVIYNTALQYYTIWICREDQTAAIEEKYKEADAALKKIDRSLKAKVEFMPLDMNESSKGEMYQKVLNAIKSRVFDEVIKKVEQVAKDNQGNLTDRSQKALLNMVDRLNAINILNDQDISRKLEKVKQKILTKEIETIREEFTREITAMKGRGAYLEFRE